jgi:hypothetical protein
MKVFISYCQSSEISKQSRELADKLIKTGIDCMLDQYISHAPEGWPKWMEKEIRESDYVLVLCTKNYFDRALGNR